MSPVQKKHIAAFDEIARVNEQYGKAFLLSSSLDKCSFSYVLDFLKEYGRLCTIYISLTQQGFDFYILLLKLSPLTRGLRKLCLIFPLYLRVI